MIADDNEKEIKKMMNNDFGRVILADEAVIDLKGGTVLYGILPKERAARLRRENKRDILDLKGLLSRHRKAAAKQTEYAVPEEDEYGEPCTYPIQPDPVVFEYWDAIRCHI